MGGFARRLRHDAGYWLLRGFLAAAWPLPLAFLRSLGGGLGWLALRFSRADRERALAHLALAFPDRDPAWRRRTLERCARHLGTVLGEVAWLWSASPAAILARTEFVGLDNLNGCVGPRRGVMVITGHCGNWEWLNLALGAIGHPLMAAAREVYDPRLDEVARRLRGRFGGETTLRGPGAGGKLVQALRRGRSLGLLIDQDIDAPGVFVEFFGHPAWTPSGAALLGLRTHSPLLPVFAARLPDGTMRVTISPPVTLFAVTDVETGAARLTAALTGHIERHIREFPEQWVWLHRRWKHQPGDDDVVWRDEDAVPSSVVPAVGDKLG